MILGPGVSDFGYYFICTLSLFYIHSWIYFLDIWIIICGTCMLPFYWLSFVQSLPARYELFMYLCNQYGVPQIHCFLCNNYLCLPFVICWYLWCYFTCASNVISSFWRVRKCPLCVCRTYTWCFSCIVFLYLFRWTCHKHYRDNTDWYNALIHCCSLLESLHTNDWLRLGWMPIPPNSYLISQFTISCDILRPSALILLEWMVDSACYLNLFLMCLFII